MHYHRNMLKFTILIDEKGVMTYWVSMRGVSQEHMLDWGEEKKEHPKKGAIIKTMQ